MTQFSKSSKVQSSVRLGVTGTLRTRIRLKHFSRSTEKTYVHWAKAFLVFHKPGNRRPSELTEQDIVTFLNYLAVQRRVAASTQNQAFNAIVFLFREVLKIQLGEFKELVCAKRIRGKCNTE